MLVGCEFSGVVRDAFRFAGHEAKSCDILPDHNPHHIKADIMLVVPRGGKLAILHPPCTKIAVSGNRWYAGTVERELLRGPSRCGNRPSNTSNASRSKTPSAHCRAHGASPIKSFSLGSMATARSRPRVCGSITCRPCAPQTSSAGASNAFGRCRPAPTGGRLRSITYQGIADAMADQWGWLL